MGQIKDADYLLINQEDKTYKISATELGSYIGQLIGIHVGEFEPSDPIDGSLWVNTNFCPPELYVWGGESGGDCEDKWYPVVPPNTTSYVKMNDDGDVYVPGTLYVSGDVLVNDDTTGGSEDPDTGRIILDGAGNAYVTGNVYVPTGKDLLTSQFSADFDGQFDALVDDSGDLIVTGHLYVGGTVVTNYQP